VVVLGMGLLWGSYTVVFWGWTLVKGYDLPLTTIVKPSAYAGAWPPAQLPDTAVLNINGAASKQAAGGPPAASGGALGALGSTLGQLKLGGGSLPSQQAPADPFYDQYRNKPPGTYPDPKGNYPGGIVVSK